MCFLFIPKIHTDDMEKIVVVRMTADPILIDYELTQVRRAEACGVGELG